MKASLFRVQKNLRYYCICLFLLSALNSFNGFAQTSSQFYVWWAFTDQAGTQVLNCGEVCPGQTFCVINQSRTGGEQGTLQSPTCGTYTMYVLGYPGMGMRTLATIPAANWRSNSTSTNKVWCVTLPNDFNVPGPTTGGVCSIPNLRTWNLYISYSNTPTPCTVPLPPLNSGQWQHMLYLHVDPFPAAPIVRNDTVCRGASANLQVIANTASSATSYQWFTTASGGTPIFTGNTYTTPPLTANTSYYVAGVNRRGCPGPRVEVRAILKPLPVVNLGPDQSLCAGSCVFIGSNTSLLNYTYQWYVNGTLNSNTSAGMQVCAQNKPVTYVLVVRDQATGCVNSDTIQITTNPGSFVDPAFHLREIQTAGGYYTMEATLLSPMVSGAQQYWTVEVLNSTGTTVLSSTGTPVSQPLAWSVISNPGFYGNPPQTFSNYSFNNPLVTGTSFVPGRFYNNLTYKITRGVKSQCIPSWITRTYTIKYE